jgi:spermidine/putrescine transport system substrate-binding protein
VTPAPTPPSSSSADLASLRVPRRTLMLGGLAAAGTWLAGSCSSGSDGGSATSDSVTSSATGELGGSLTILNYPDWIGSTQLETFRDATGVTVEQVAGLTSGSAAAAAQISQNQDDFDLSFAPLALAGQLEAAGLIQPLDPARTPNVGQLPADVLALFPYGAPTDFGKVGFGYRSDLVTERPTSWAELWELAPKYSGQIVFTSYDTDVLGSALKYVGHSANSVDAAELDEALEALLAIKPHLLALLPTDISKPMLEGDAVFTLTYDYEVALAGAENPDITWVAPSEGMTGYIEGWVIIEGTEELEAAEAFIDHQFLPEVYADFINTTGAAYLLPDAESLIDPSISGNPSLRFDPATIANVEFEEFKGEAIRERTAVWETFKSA